MRTPNITWGQWTCAGASLAAAGVIAWLFSLASRAAEAAEQGHPVCGTEDAFGILAAVGLLTIASLSVLLSLRSGGPRWLTRVLLTGVGLLWIAFFAAT